MIPDRFKEALQLISENQSLDQPTTLLADGRWAKVHRTQAGNILKLSRIPTEAKIAEFLKNNNCPAELPRINHVQSISEGCWGIWREDLDDCSLTCCPFPEFWKRLVSVPREYHHDKRKLLLWAPMRDPLDCHLDALANLFVWLGTNRIVMRDLVMENWGLRGDQLVIRDFGRGFFF